MRAGRRHPFEVPAVPVFSCATPFVSNETPNLLTRRDPISDLPGAAD